MNDNETVQVVEILIANYKTVGSVVGSLVVVVVAFKMLQTKVVSLTKDVTALKTELRNFIQEGKVSEEKKVETINELDRKLTSLQYDLKHNKEYTSKTLDNLSQTLNDILKLIAGVNQG